MARYETINNSYERGKKSFNFEITNERMIHDIDEFFVGKGYDNDIDNIHVAGDQDVRSMAEAIWMGLYWGYEKDEDSRKRIPHKGLFVDGFVDAFKKWAIKRYF